MGRGLASGETRRAGVRRIDISRPNTTVATAAAFVDFWYRERSDLARPDAVVGDLDAQTSQRE
jgi:hypothetical protein